MSPEQQLGPRSRAQDSPPVCCCDMEAARRDLDVNGVVAGYLRDLAFAQTGGSPTFERAIETHAGFCDRGDGRCAPQKFLLSQ